jgi:hypothetical protein
MRKGACRTGGDKGGAVRVELEGKGQGKGKLNDRSRRRRDAVKVFFLEACRVVLWKHGYRN